MPEFTVSYQTDRFQIRNLTIEDANQRYLNWLNDEAAQRFIVAAADCNELQKLKDYVDSKIKSADCLFLGIFEKDTMTHIGNVKYEPIDLEKKTAVMGILIGDPSWRGKAVAREVILSSANYLKQSHGIRDIVLGVETDNAPAIRAYEKMGFTEFSDEDFQPKPGAMYMKLSL